MNIPQYNVVLLNDDTHSFGYVIQMLTELFKVDKKKALEFAKLVDSNGRVVVFTGCYEHAEFKRDQIIAFGPDCSMPTSYGGMNCELEHV